MVAMTVEKSVEVMDFQKVERMDYCWVEVKVVQLAAKWVVKLVKLQALHLVAKLAAPTVSLMEQWSAEWKVYRSVFQWAARKVVKKVREKVVELV